MPEHSDIEELLANPVWEELVMELKARQEVLLSEMLKKDLPEAIEYKSISRLIERPREMLDELRAEKQGGK